MQTKSWLPAALLILPMLLAADARKATLHLGEAKLLVKPSADWKVSDPGIAEIYKNGYVAALKIGDATLSLGDETWDLHVVSDAQHLVDPSTLKEYPDDRRFTINGRRCVGSELCGQMVGMRGNRVRNPSPLAADNAFLWEIEKEAPIYDGAGTKMGTAASTLDVHGRRVYVTKINFGMTKVINGRLCVYAFSIDIKPDAAIEKDVDPKSVTHGKVATSAWLPIDSVLKKEKLLELDGVGKGKLPKLPLEDKKFRITGGDPNEYLVNGTELSIVPRVYADGPAPSHYLRRPSGTVNIIYSVPGFGLGGQGLDSFLISTGVIFHPAKGVRTFVQPTFYPVGNPDKGKKADKTMTFIYGAVEVPGSETIYGWVAKEAMVPEE